MSLFSVEEVASQLRLHPRTVYRLLESGRLRGRRVGRQWRVEAEALRQMTGQPGIACDLDEETGRLLDEAIDQTIERILSDDFAHSVTESDVAADHRKDLQEKLDPGQFEVHLDLAVGGTTGKTREKPDVSVIPRLGPQDDRRGTEALYSAEVTFFTYRGPLGYRLTDKQFVLLLEEMERQFKRLAERIEAGLLAAGWLVWVDAFDWMERLPQVRRIEVIQEREKWVQETFDKPGCRVRVDYLPVWFPDHRVSLSNGFLESPDAASNLLGESARLSISPEERAARVDGLVGKYAHVPTSTDQFIRRKQEDIERENRRWVSGSADESGDAGR